MSNVAIHHQVVCVSLYYADRLGIVQCETISTSALS